MVMLPQQAEIWNQKANRVVAIAKHLVKSSCVSWVLVP